MIVSTSILASDFSKFESQINKLNKSSDWLHYDVMDGHFVKNLTFGIDIFKGLRKLSPLFLDVHLMVDNPKDYIDKYIENGADNITFHYESLDSIDACIDLLNRIKTKYVKAGISIKPDTNVEDIEPLLSIVDLVLIMSVEPGFGGQKFMSNSLDKIAYLDNYRNEHNLNYIIQVDGGINDRTGNECKKKGCDCLVSGSFIFDGDIGSNIKKLK